MAEYKGIRADRKAKLGERLTLVFQGIFCAPSELAEEYNTCNYDVDVLFLELRNQNYNLDTLLGEPNNQTYSIDVIFQKLMDKTYYLNVLLEKSNNQSYNVDIIIKSKKVYNIDLLLQKIIALNYNLDILLEKLSNNQVYDINLLLQELKNQIYNIDVFLKKVKDYDIDSLLQGLESQNYNTNVLLLKELIDKIYNIDSLLQKIINKDYNIDLIIEKLASSILTLDLLIQQLVPFDYLINALLQTTNSYSYNLEISLFDTKYVFFDGMKLQLVWNDEFNNSEIDAIKRLTLAQNYNIQEFNVCEKPITLEATENQGWLTRKQVEMLYEKASVPNKIYPLIYNGKHYLVRFRWEDPPVIDVTPILPRPNMADDDYYYGTIKLMQILR